MSRKSAKKANDHSLQPELIFDAKRDINPFWRSSLFSDVYLKNDVPREYKHLWENDEIGGFHDFYQGFVDLCVETEHETFEKWKEADTVKNWIVHVMDLLGWENNSERRSNSYMDNESFTVVDNGRKQTYRPDLIYFDKPKHKSYTQKEKDIDRKLSEARNKRTGTKIVVEAKYWDRLSHMAEQSKKDAKINDSASALGPELQTLKYMEIFDHDFGVLTDGKTWRLFHKELSQGMDRRSFDFDLGNLRELAFDLDSYQNEEKFRHYAKYFYYFFSKESLIQTEESKTAPFVHEVFEYSKKYAHSIEDDLKKRFIVSMGVTCNALKKSCEDSGEEINLETIRNVSESHLFNILFIKSCEVRRVLPISSTQYLRVSLHEVVETLDVMDFDPEKDWDDYLRDFKYAFGKKFDWDGYEIFNRFVNLYSIIHDGTARSKDFGFEVKGFKESIFNKKEWRFAKMHKIENRDMINILFNLNFIESKFKGRKYQQIPYSYFTPRQLGAIYESFLEYKLEIADTDMIFTKSAWSPANLKSGQVKKLKLVDEHIVRKDNLYFSPDNEERKMTGSYYTPDYIVKYIVQNTLGEILGKKVDCKKILELKICDPAMGSGHFLAGAIDYLVEKYRESWAEENNDDLDESIEETSRKILKHCVFGSDINPRAVKLAKMSLWLLTAFPGKKLETLDDQLFNHDSLLEMDEFEGHFDAIIGNPPYIRGKLLEKNYKKEIEEKYISATGIYDLYVVFIESSLKLLKPKGRLGYITPSKYAYLDFGNGVRNFIRENKYGVEKFIDFADNQVFDGATTYCAITIFSRDNKKVNYYKYPNKSKKMNIEKHLNELMFEEHSYNVIEKEPWNFTKTRKKKSTSKYVKLSELCEKIFQGLVLTPTQSFPVKILNFNGELGSLDKIVNVEQVKSKTQGCLESEILVPILKSSNIHRNDLQFANYFSIFPYSKEDYSLFNSNVMKKLYPKALEFLNLVKEPLITREKGKWAESETWYEFSRVQSFDCHSRRKILVPGLAKEPRFAIDDGKYFIDQGSYGLILREEYLDIESFILASLNSERTKKYIESVSPMLSGGYYNYQTKYLKDLEIALPSDSDVEKVVSLYVHYLRTKDDKAEKEIAKIVASF